MYKGYKRESGLDSIEYLQHTAFWVLTSGVFVSVILVIIYNTIVVSRKREKTDNSKSRVVIITILTFVFVGWHWLFVYLVINNNPFWSNLNLLKVLIILSAICVFALLFIIIKYNRSNSKNNLNRRVYKTALNRITGFFNSQHYITVRVNLGKDKLTEKDVLKYITNELYKEYSGWFTNFKNIKRVINTIGLVTLLYFFFTLFYNGFLGSEFSTFSNRTVSISYYFPSQSLLVSDKDINSAEVDDLFQIKDSETNVLRQRTLEEYIDKLQAKIDENDKNKIVLFKKNIYKKNNRNAKGGYSIWTKVHYGIIQVCNELDYLTLKLWIKTKRLLFFDHFDNEKSPICSLVNKIYPNVPILFIYVLIVSFLIVLRFIPKRFVIIKSHFHSLRNLKNIKRQIEASITFEENANAMAMQTSWFNFKKRINYLPLESKDITQKLIHLLDEIDQISPIFTKVKFVFVFDELDKINPHNAVVLSSREDEFETDHNEVRYQARRKERIALILSSMKHFLNSAKAKFIFIAGREMYDAALAGISDRESSLDSIFSDNKIYINSFYTEEADGNKSDITSITEQYLCQFLIPDHFTSKHNEKPSLNLYNKFLKEYYYNKYEAETANEKREKIITVLKDFIVYLSYRSNGAPRKLSNLIEQYVKPVLLNDLEDNGRVIVGRNDHNLYLNIGYYDQYKFSLVSSMTTPVFLGIGNFLHEYSDKLLVSISYMLDHLYKFHKFGISYRSLSLTPEIIDINKEPQFREFLDKLVQTLSSSHLRPIVSGIYDFKFHSKISSEVKFLSKIDELEGAALNFTLDESIELKRYFNKRLEQLETKDNQRVLAIGREEEDHVNNKGLLHVMIGDLHFYDEEYQEAISHYLESIQNLRQRNVRDMVLYDFILFVRNKLKLALAFEKNKMYDNALMTYSELTDLIVRKRNIPMRKFGLARIVIKPEELELMIGPKVLCPFNEISRVDQLMAYIKTTSKGNPDFKKRELVVLGRLKPEIIKSIELKDDNTNDWKKLYPLNAMEVYYGINSDELIKNIENIDTNYKPLKHFFLQSTLENIRLLYQPVIAKLHMIEKSSPDKIKDIDIVRAIKEFDFIKLPLKRHEKRVVISEFYNKIGDLLYFKNGTLNKCLKHLILTNLEELAESNNRDDEIKALKNLLVTPIDASIFYIKSLSVLLVPIQQDCAFDSVVSNKNEINIIEYYEALRLDSVNRFSQFFLTVKSNFLDIRSKLDIITKENKNSFKERYSYEYLSSIANGTIDLAESLSSFVLGSFSEKHTPEKFQLFFDSFGLGLDDVLRLYFQAYQIYNEIGSYRLAKSQLLKILHVLREASVSNKCNFLIQSGNGIFDNMTIDDIVDKAIKTVYATYDQSHFIEGKKISEIFRDNNSSHNDVKTSLTKSNVVIEINEIILLLWRIELNKIDRANDKAIIDFYNKVNDNINTLSYIRRKHNRILQLRLKLKINRILFDRYFDNTSSFNYNWVPDVFADFLEPKINSIITERFEQKDTKDFFDSVPEDFSAFLKSKSLSKYQFKVSLILDSIGANNELLKTHYLFDINYVTTNHNQLAKAHYSMAFWSKQYDKINDDGDFTMFLQNDILNTQTSMNINEAYHLNQALEYNRKAKNFHSRGKSLNQFLKTASYLDDFFNDNLIHFSIAVERNTIHEKYCGSDSFIEKISKEINDLRIDNEDPFDYKNYYF